MYKDFEEEFLLKDYFNLNDIDYNNNKYDYFNNNYNNNNSEILTPIEGLTIGNLFANLYSPYKHHVPRELKSNNQKGCMLLRIQSLDLAVNDLNLYLDINPEDKEAFNLFKSYVIELNNLSKVYSEKYELLELNHDIGQNFTWYKKPWPWQVQDV